MKNKLILNVENRNSQKGYEYLNFNYLKPAGFTLIEMLVVISILGILLGIVVLDFSRQRQTRGLNIAQNEMVTNIRKAQSNSLFSRNIEGQKPVQYYILKFSTSAPDRYFMEAISDVKVAPRLNQVETIRLPQNIFISAIRIRRPAPPYISQIENSNCALLAFKLPFAKTYVNNGCFGSGFTGSDDYQKIISHISNISSLTVSIDTDLIITVQNKIGNLTRQILVKGVTGIVCPTLDGINCG